MMTTSPPHWVFRIGVAACFIGHGAFGIIPKLAWVAYRAVWGISEGWAWTLMPVVGTVTSCPGCAASRDARQGDADSEPPSGVAQMATPRVAPAIAAAVSTATRTRLRHTPSIPERALAATSG